MLTPLFDVNRKRRSEPCTARQIVCSGLEILAGGHFLELIVMEGALVTGESITWINMYKLVDAVVSPEIR